MWTTFNSPRESRASALESVAALQSLFREFTDSRVRRAFGDLDVDRESSCAPTSRRFTRPDWVDGRVALLGDAAHALTPNMGQGAGMAMEDAAVLAEELAGAARGETAVEEALTSYVARRRDRVEAIVRLSRQIGEEGQLTGPLACWLRNRRIRREGRSPERTRAALERMLAWPPRGESVR